jgi:hypothetical protein
MGFFNVPPPKSSTAGQNAPQPTSAPGGYALATPGVQMNVPAGHMAIGGKIAKPAGLGGNPMAGTNPFRKIKR